MRFRLVALGFGLLLAFFSSPSLAADDVDEESAPAEVEEDQPFSGVVSPGVALEDASDEQKKSAQQAFLKGDKAFDVQSYQEALEHFTESYSTVASPNSRLMVARCLLEIGRLDEAYDEYSGVMKDAEGNDDYETTGTTAKKEREALRHRLAWLTVKLGDVPEGSRLTVGGRERTSESLEAPIAVTPGKTAVKATTDDGQVAEATVHLAAGRAASVELKIGETITVGDPPPPQKVANKEEVVPPKETPPPPTERRTSLRPYAYGAAAVGVVGFAGFTTFGMLSTSRYNALEEDCADGVCPPQSQDDIDTGKQMQLFANVGLGVGIAGVLGSVALFVLDGKKERPVDVRVGYKSVMVGGSF